MAYSPVMLAMQGLGLTPVLRMAKEKAVSTGFEFLAGVSCIKGV